MSTDSGTTISLPPEPHGSGTMGPVSPAAQGATAPPDVSLVEQTRREIQQIASEIAELAKEDIPPTEFYGRFLPSVISALGALGGAIWTVSEAGELSLEYQVNLSAARLDDDARRGRHTLLLRQTIAEGNVHAVPPHSGASDEGEAGNLTEYLLLHGPLSSGNRVVGVVEIFQRSDAGPTTQRGYLRFLTQMTDVASGYLKSRSLQNFSDRQQLWQRLEQYITCTHESLDPRVVAYTIANEGRQLIDCDRVSLLVRKGKRYRVEAVSGIDRVDSRAVHIRNMEKLVACVCATGEPLWHHGDTSDVPPQIEEGLHALIDETHAHTVAVVPLVKMQPTEASDGESSQRDVKLNTAPLGALLVEQFQEQELPRGFRHRVRAVADHGGAALANALAHHSIFLLWLWQWLGGLRAVVAARNLPKTVAIIAGVFGAAAALTLIPADFEVEGRGTLEPSIRLEVFAAVDGTVIDVPVTHGQEVNQGQLLVELRGTSDLDVALADLVGKKLAARERVAALERQLHGPQRQNPEDQDRLSGELFQLNKTIDSLQKQLDLYQKKQEQLSIASPIQGQVATWQPRDRLLRRRVRPGQALLTVVDSQGPWELEIQMPQRRIGHLKRAEATSDDPLPVSFMLATHPGEQFTGQLKEIGQVADSTDAQEPTVLVRVAINKVDLPELRPGSTVSARVACGQRALGYVWLHDVFEFVQSRILFRL